MNPPTVAFSSPRRVRPAWCRLSACCTIALLTRALAVESPTLPAAPAEPPAAAKGESRPARAIHTVAPKHPEALKQKLIAGDCEIECVVGQDGRVVRTKVISTTQPEFGQEAEIAVRQWEFQPGLRDGQPVPMTVRIPFSFNFTRDQVVEIIARRQVFQEVSGTVIPAEQMPVWPKPVQIYLPPYPSELKGSGKRGKAVVAIVIDKEGRVINPKIVKATYPEFAMPALATAVRLVFPPQKVGGLNAESIYVSMDIQFDFTDTARPAPTVSEVKAGPETKKSKPD